MRITKITPTIFLTGSDSSLRQLVKLTLNNHGNVRDVIIGVRAAGAYEEIDLQTVPNGESVRDVYIKSIDKKDVADFILKVDGKIESRSRITVLPPKHWIVHVVQRSHHDLGYTDLPSNVLFQHDGWLDNAVDAAVETEDYPADSRFRIVIEQAWSLLHYLEHANTERIQEVIRLLKSGHFEATALFGNMITELCGHETMTRLLYPSFGLKKRYGIPIVSAEHNDITGFSWGLSQVLTNAGVKIFCPGIPLYYSWDKDLNLRSFWDEKELFPHGGPGAFWWQAPDGKKLLFWCNNSGCGGEARTALPQLAARLEELAEVDYPYSILRWPVRGGDRDNSPYNIGYSKTIKAWNEKWTYPHLVCSTNTMFYEDFIKIVPDDLPVFHGELPGQDYPSGAMSTATATAVNRTNQNNILSAEIMAASSSLKTDYVYQKEALSEAYEEILTYNEHTWGFQLPCGPVMAASRSGKELHAYKAAALIHDVSNKSLARIADQIKKEDGFYLVVFNPTCFIKTAPVRAMLREIENCGSTMNEVQPEDDPVGAGYLKGVVLTDRLHLNLPPKMVEGDITVADAHSGKALSSQVIEIESPDDTRFWAAERFGLSAGGKRLGLFELPLGLRRELCFIARDVPPFGYKTYLMKTGKSSRKPTVLKKNREIRIENEYFLISADAVGGLKSIWDKKKKRELIDPHSTFSFNTLVVRNPLKKDLAHLKLAEVRLKNNGPICYSIEMKGNVSGHPAVTQTVSLYRTVPNIYLDTRILKDSTPLLEAYLAFPFNTGMPEFEYEGSLSVMAPIEDFMPGTDSDTLAVQNWVRIRDGDYSLLWSSLDAPVASFSSIWPGRISPAHRCIQSPELNHPPVARDDLARGWIFSQIFSNNFGTNFNVSQVTDQLFRYVITAGSGDVSNGEAFRFGSTVCRPFETILCGGNDMGELPLSMGLLEIDDGEVVVVTFKKAENGPGYVIRMWNTASAAREVNVRTALGVIESVRLLNIVEEPVGEELSSSLDSFKLYIDGRSISTVEIVFSPPVVQGSYDEKERKVQNAR